MKQWRTAWFVVLAMCVMAVPAFAQVSTGRIEVTVVDTTGAVLPGALVDLGGPQKETVTTGADGVARFLNLPPGVYTVKATLQGFGEYNNTSVPVGAGGAVQLKASLGVAGMKQEVEVTAQTPVIDAKKSGTSTNVTLEELQNIPSARDPWVVMQTVPGIIVDRVNVGGSESGQQSGYQAKGASGADATWNMDGIPITDMSATGATPMYYDFDMFQEMNVSTGGSDLTATTGGVALNFILRSGTDSFRGSARVYYENESMQWNNMPADLAASIGGASGKGNRTDYYQDMGFEIGGPIVKSKLWFWGSVGNTDVQILTLTGVNDRTTPSELLAEAPGPDHQGPARGLHLLLRRQEQVGPERQRDEAGRNDLQPDGSQPLLQGRGQLRRGQQPVPHGTVCLPGEQFHARPARRHDAERVRRRWRRVARLGVVLHHQSSEHRAHG